MDIFSEVFGCYFMVVSGILERAEYGMTKEEIEKFVSSHGFYDSTFHLLPELFEGRWQLLREDAGIYYSRLEHGGGRPFTFLEKAWLKTLLDDPRISLFLEREQISELEGALHEVEPLFRQGDFFIYDQHLDGDDYREPGYIERFKVIQRALREYVPLLIEYDGPKGGRTRREYYPRQLCYSSRDDKFRLYCAVLNRKRNCLHKCVLNLGRITEVHRLDQSEDRQKELSALYERESESEPVVLEISRERNALERCMLQFASFKKQTEYDKSTERYTCRIWYDQADETELLIRILSFGPVVNVTGPEEFIRQIRMRIERQRALNMKYKTK